MTLLIFLLRMKLNEFFTKELNILTEKI
ncbi:MAG: hypothetical protein RLY31_2677, partial [Bacteroidota bacterium]